MAAKNMNKEQFEQALRGELPLLVDYWAPWCGYCKRIDPVYDKIAEEYEGRVFVAKINVDEEPEMAQAEQIEVIPTLILYRGGKAIASVVAPESKGMIDRFIHNAMEK